MARWLDTDVMRPTEILTEVLSGRMDMTSAPKAIQSQAHLPIYDAASTILAQPNIAKRRKMLAKIPELIRPYIEDEINRLWKMRKENAAKAE